MKHRNQYKQIEDFLVDISFQKWVKEGIDQNDWEEWTVEEPERARQVSEARLWLLAMVIPETPQTVGEIRTALTGTWDKIRQAENRIETLPVPIWKRYVWQSAAATLLLSIGLIWLYQQQIQSRHRLSYAQLVNHTSEGLIEQTNNTSKPQLITLSDGSSVLLQPQSKLSYPRRFKDKERNVYLSGEGFFEISKNPQKPFYIFANEVVTRVVGTSFRVKAYADQPDIEVTVHTGKVSVSHNNLIKEPTNNGVMLLSNQSVRFVRKELTFEKTTDVALQEELSQALTPIEQINFDFLDAPVTQILKTIEKAYLVDIDYPHEKLKDCYLTTSLSDQPLSEKLKIICESLGKSTRYEMNGNQVIILTNGCN